jgi:hypothetical protein
MPSSVGTACGVGENFAHAQLRILSRVAGSETPERVSSITLFGYRCHMILLLVYLYLLIQYFINISPNCRARKNETNEFNLFVHQYLIKINGETLRLVKEEHGEKNMQA